VIVNGDIVDLASARDALSQSGASAVMLGRGAQGQPWAVGQIGAALEGRDVQDAPKGSELIDLISTHYEAMLDEYGIAIGVRVARKHLDWYLEALGIELEKDRRRTLLGLEEPAAMLVLIKEVYGETRRHAA
jgi:tRNA-dihydrouridine synthase B